jgi:molecular chaperone GrpE
VSETTAPETAPSELDQLKNKLEESEKKYVYLYADFENYKKRIDRELSENRKFGSEPLIHELLQIIDNLERALAHTVPGVDPNLIAGLNMVLKQFNMTLEKYGVRRIESSFKPFDPHLHEAVAQEPSDKPEGVVLKEHSSGYTLHGRLLRPARVVVSKKAEGQG